MSDSSTCSNSELPPGAPTVTTSAVRATAGPKPLPSPLWRYAIASHRLARVRGVDFTISKLT
eukprot:12896559-Prorocentrum_lima.AAC.1